MPAPTRIGDSWTFMIPSTQTVREQYVFVNLGVLPLADDYHVIATLRATWTDPSGESVDRSLGLNIELKAFDAQDQPLESWDNDMNIVQDRRWMTAPGARYDQPLIQQAIIHQPIETAMLKLSLNDQSGASPGDSPVIEGRMVFTIVTPR
jgi:hypothetical protein